MRSCDGGDLKCTRCQSRRVPARPGAPPLILHSIPCRSSRVAQRSASHGGGDAARCCEGMGVGTAAISVSSPKTDAADLNCSTPIMSTIAAKRRERAPDDRASPSRHTHPSRQQARPQDRQRQKLEPRGAIRTAGTATPGAAQAPQPDCPGRRRIRVLSGRITDHVSELEMSPEENRNQSLQSSISSFLIETLQDGTSAPAVGAGNARVRGAGDQGHR